MHVKLVQNSGHTMHGLRTLSQQLYSMSELPGSLYDCQFYFHFDAISDIAER